MTKCGTKISDEFHDLRLLLDESVEHSTALQLFLKKRGLLTSSTCARLNDTIRRYSRLCVVLKEDLHATEEYVSRRDALNRLGAPRRRDAEAET